MPKTMTPEDYKLIFGNFGSYVDFTDKNTSVQFYCKQMLNRTNRMFKYKGLPDTIPEKVLELMLQNNGFAVITKVLEGEIKYNKDIYFEGYYVFSEGVGLGGPPDIYYRPTIATIANPAMGLSIQRTIGVDCVVIRNDVLLMGLRPVNSRYASLLTENDITFRLYDINSRISALISSPDSKVAESAKQYLIDIEAGKLGVIADSKLLDAIKSQPYQGTTDKLISLIEYHQYINSKWENAVGINSNYNMKREALGDKETSANVASLLPFTDTMLSCRQEDFELSNKLLGTNISVELDSTWQDIQTEVEQEQTNEPTKEPENIEKEVTENENT